MECMNAFYSAELWVDLKEQGRQRSFYYLQTEPKACGKVQNLLLEQIFLGSGLNNKNNIKLKTDIMCCKKGSS